MLEVLSGLGETKGFPQDGCEDGTYIHAYNPINIFQNMDIITQHQDLFFPQWEQTQRPQTSLEPSWVFTQPPVNKRFESSSQFDGK